MRKLTSAVDPNGPAFAANARVNDSTNPFVPAYTLCPRLPRRAAIEEIFTMFPRRRAAMPGSTAWQS